MAKQYNDPLGGTPSSVGPQARTDYYQRKALVEAAKEKYFEPLASTFQMPKHYGKKIIRNHYLPILDDANINDQGIDAAGNTSTQSVTIIISHPDLVSTGNGYVDYYAYGEGANAGAALTAAQADAVNIFKDLGVFDTNYATTKTAVEAAGWTVAEQTAVAAGGNLYGSSKDVGTITGKLPALSETGGRVNRVGHTRIQIEGTLEKFGFFDEYTKESLDFDSDDMLEEHITREMVMAANEITEDALQIDLLNSAGVLRLGGDATTTAELTGETGDTKSVPVYDDFLALSISLDNNRCPKTTKMITGSRFLDTRVIEGGRVMYIGTELEPMVRKMVDPFGNPAFISVAQYGAAGNVIRGEIGTVGQFRIVVVPEMMHWEGVGKAVTSNGGYHETNGQYDVYPMLVVGDESFTTIGFNTDGKNMKFKIKHRKPETEGAYTADDPYGEKGFMSIKWYYGFMVLRPERIALVKSVAPYI